VGEDAAVEAPIAFGLGLNGAMEGTQARCIDAFQEVSVEARVLLEDVEGIYRVLAGGVGEAPVQRRQFGRECGAAAGREFRGPAGGERLDLTEDAEHLAGVVACERRDAEPYLPARVGGEHIPLLTQALQSAAHRCPADAEAGGDLALDDAAPGREAAAHDQFTEAAVRFVDPIFGVRRLLRVLFGMAEQKIRVLVAKPGLDGHDRGAKVIASALRDAGMEVIYTGLHQTPEMVVSAAIQEDVDVVAMSILSGAHMTLFPRVRELLAAEGADHILLTGGGIIPEEDMKALEGQGIGKLFGPGTTTTGAAVEYIRDWYAENGRDRETVAS
jgi:methylmalonyl-CoA mutase, C-terminal domain